MSFFGVIEGVAVVVMIASLLLGKWKLRLFLIALAVAASSLTLHAVITSDQKRGFRLFSLPEQPTRTTFFLKLFDEKDIVYLGTALYGHFAGLKPFDNTFEKQFETLQDAIGWPLATPVLSSLFEKDASTQNWAVEFVPQEATQLKPAIYLHGAMGSYVIQCWMTASILLTQGFAVVCPALSFNARWSSPTGEKVLSRAVEYINIRYPNEKILYVGLSNGATGLTSYRKRLSRNASGFILISGGGTVQFYDEIPTLLLWGRDDQSTSFSKAVKIRSQNQNLTLESVEADHSAFARQHSYFGGRIKQWLRKVGI